MRPVLLLSGLLPLFGMAACTDKTDDVPVDDSQVPDDSEPIQYEEGCILVDGDRSFAHLEDAYTVAGEGSVITLCEGLMELEATFVISKSVRIEGPGADLLTWNAPVNQAAIEVLGAATVELSGFSVTSTRNGIEVNESSDVSLSDISFVTIANTGLKIKDSTGVQVDSVTFITPAYGGVDVDGGSVTISNADFQAPVAFAVKAQGGAAVTVASSLIDGVTYTDATEGLIDGFALWAIDGASLSTEGNVMTNNVIHVLTEEADLTMSGDSVSGGLYGVLGLLGDIDISGVTITDPYFAALRLLNQTQSLSVSDTDITGTPELVSPDEYNFDSYIGGAMTIATDSTATFSNMNISGYNSMGVIMLGYSDAPTVVMDNVTISSPGRYGLRMHGADATLTNVTVDSMRLVDDPDEVNLNGSYNTGFAVSLWECATTWTGGGVYNSELIGMINYQGSLQASDWHMEDSTVFGLWNYYGSALVEQGYFTGSSNDGGIANYYGDLILKDSTFQDNLATYKYEYEYESGGELYTYGYEYSNQSQDIICYQATGCQILNNTFTDGSSGMQASSSAGVVIEGNTWENYSNQAISLYSNTESAELTDNTFKNLGYFALYCYASPFDADNLNVDGVVGATTTVTYYSNGELDGTYTYTSSGQAMYLYSCNATLTDSIIQDAKYHALYASDSSLELYDLIIDGGSSGGSSGYGTLQASWSSTQPYLQISGLQVNQPEVGYGISLTGTGLGDAGDVWLDDVSVSGAPRGGIYASTLGGVTLDGVTVSESASTGLYLDGVGDVVLSDVTLKENTGYGLYADGRWDYDGDGFSIGDGDCNDYYATRYPGATESVNSLDDDCDGVADDGSGTGDADGDGHTIAAGDCDDTNSSIYPGALERSWGVDDDCDGLADGGQGALIDLSGLSASANSSGGAYLYRVEGTLGAAALSSNSGYGLTCSTNADVESCDSADLSNNSSGEVTGCAACAE